MLPLLGWDDLGRPREAGVTLGADTRSHSRLTRQEEPLLEAELAGAAAEMEHRLGEVPPGLAYPYGDVDDRVVRAAATFRNPARLADWGSPGFRVWLWFRRQGRRVRASLAPASGG